MVTTAGSVVWDITGMDIVGSDTTATTYTARRGLVKSGRWNEMDPWLDSLVTLKYIHHLLGVTCPKIQVFKKAKLTTKRVKSSHVRPRHEMNIVTSCRDI